MRITPALLCVVTLVACGDPPAEAPDIEPEPPAPTDPPAPPPAPPPPASTHAWRWYHEGPERDTGGMLGEGAVHDHTGIYVVGAPRRFVVAREGETLVVRREDRAAWDDPVEPAWVRRYELEATGEPVITGDLTDHLLAAAPTARGYVLASIDPEDGALRWQRENDLDGPGPVQLETGEALVAFVRATPAPYLHELDPETGAVTARARFGTEVLRSSFTPPPVRGLPRNRPSPGGWRLVREGREALGVDGPGGRAVLAEHDLFSDHAAFVELDDTVVVVTFCANASGASAFGVDRATGRRLWQSSPGSIGPIGHSRYSNDVRATLEDGRVVVYAQESSGRYVGVLDPSEGRLIGYEVWRR